MAKDDERGGLGRWTCAEHNRCISVKTASSGRETSLVVSLEIDEIITIQEMYRGLMLKSSASVGFVSEKGQSQPQESRKSLF